MELIWCRECECMAALRVSSGWKPLRFPISDRKRRTDPTLAKAPVGVCTPCWRRHYAGRGGDVKVVQPTG